MKIQKRNAVSLIGDVVSVDVKGRTIVLLTKQSRQSGTYEDLHHVIVPNMAFLKKLKEGQKLRILAQLDRNDEAFSTQIVADPKNISIGKKSDGYDNEAELVGDVPYSAAMLPADEGKISLANLAIEVGGKVFNGVAFRQLATIFDRTWHKGAMARLKGRLRRREFTNNDGDEITAVEIVAEDKALTRVLKSALKEDKFGDFGVVDGEKEETAPAETASVPAV